ncbi:NUDIX domain-containing protein [Streptomyces sp. NPDC004787]|uniref:NUDIX hydrolase n=1 Tax=Streptomyces sp. NPDC004787 TaxID=3154291 RepID=UPI0033BCBB1C
MTPFPGPQPVPSEVDGPDVPVNASALIHDGEGRYLLHLRDADKPEIWAPGTWSLLGGGREPQDASLLDTVRRELREEAGLSVPDLEEYGRERVAGPGGTPVTIQHFVGTWRGDPAALPLTEGVMLAWVRPEQFAHMTMLPSTRELLLRHAAAHPPSGAGAAPVKPARAGRAGPGSAGAVAHVVAAHLVLEHEGKVLLGLRHPDSAFAGGLWHVLAGHCEDESATACLVREAREEAGLAIDAADLELVHTVHAVDGPGQPPRLQLFFRARRWTGTPEPREPDKCVAWRWWDATDLPEALVPYTRAALDGVRAGRAYTESGWAGR